VWEAAGEATVDVVWRIDVGRWKGMLYRALAQ
jgi:hypothetical protein